MDKSGIIIDNTEFGSKSIRVDYSEFLENKLTNDTFGQRLPKSRLELALSISHVANLCGVTNSVISGYKLERYIPTKDILGKLNIWISENNLQKHQLI